MCFISGNSHKVEPAEERGEEQQKATFNVMSRKNAKKTSSKTRKEANTEHRRSPYNEPVYP